MVELSPYAGRSAWSHRLPAAALGAAGFVIAGYLALFQLGSVTSVWDPVFGDGSVQVLRSPLASALPVPDAALGAVGYLLEAVLLLAGGRARWRDRPWLVIVGALLVAAMAAGGVVLVVVQVAVLGTGCTLCLVSATISLVIAALAMPEAAATVSHLRDERRPAIDAPMPDRALAPRSAAARIHDQS